MLKEVAAVMPHPGGLTAYKTQLIPVPYSVSTHDEVSMQLLRFLSLWNHFLDFEFTWMNKFFQYSMLVEEQRPPNWMGRHPETYLKTWYKILSN